MMTFSKCPGNKFSYKYLIFMFLILIRGEKRKTQKDTFFKITSDLKKISYSLDILLNVTCTIFGSKQTYTELNLCVSTRLKLKRREKRLKLYFSYYNRQKVICDQKQLT